MNRLSQNPGGRFRNAHRQMVEGLAQVVADRAAEERFVDYEMAVDPLRRIMRSVTCISSSSFVIIYVVVDFFNGMDQYHEPKIPRTNVQQLAELPYVSPKKETLQDRLAPS